jgi:hypothetical protein
VCPTGAVRLIAWRLSPLPFGDRELGCVEVILARNANQRETPIAAPIGESSTHELRIHVDRSSGSTSPRFSPQSRIRACSSVPMIGVDDPLAADMAYASGDADEDEELDVGETWTYTATDTVTPRKSPAGGRSTTRASVTTDQGATSGDTSRHGSLTVSVSYCGQPRVERRSRAQVGTPRNCLKAQLEKSSSPRKRTRLEPPTLTGQKRSRSS